MSLLHIVAREIDQDGDRNGGHFAKVARVSSPVYDLLREEMSEWRMERNQGPLIDGEPLFVRAVMVVPDADVAVCRFDR